MRLGQVLALAELSHLTDGRARVPLGELSLRGQPGRGGTVPVGVVRVGGVESSQEAGVGGGELRLDAAKRDQDLAARRPVKPGSAGRVQVTGERVPHPQRVGDAAGHAITTGLIAVVAAHADHLLRGRSQRSILFAIFKVV